MKCRKFFRSNSGVSAVEFGLILPFLLILLLGIMDYGYVYLIKLTYTNAAREAARAVAVLDVTTLTQPAAQAAAEPVVDRYLSGIPIPKRPPVQVLAGVTHPDAATTAASVTLTLSNFRAYALIGFVPLPASLTAQATMRWELSSP
jgi:Flp pilus assembly protein TadG